MKENFSLALPLVLAHEGGYSNHPKDPGGPTNKGITQRVYDAWRRGKSLPTQSVKAIAQSEVEAIYRAQYWNAVRGDDLPAGLDYAVFDYAVNSGPSRAARDLQKQLGVTADSVIGAITLDAADAAMRLDEEHAIAAYCEERLDFDKSLSTWPTFGKGWNRRIMGDQPGVQAADKGVIDYATMIARNDLTYGMPTAIGGKPGEQAGKADPSTPARPLPAAGKPAGLAALALGALSALVFGWHWLAGFLGF